MASLLVKMATHVLVSKKVLLLILLIIYFIIQIHVIPVPVKMTVCVVSLLQASPSVSV